MTTEYTSHPQYTNPQLTVYVDDLLRRLARAESQLAVLAAQAGVKFDDPSAGAPADVVALLRAGDRLGAINRYRQLTNATMDEAKAYLASL